MLSLSAPHPGHPGLCNRAGDGPLSTLRQGALFTLSPPWLDVEKNSNHEEIRHGPHSTGYP